MERFNALQTFVCVVDLGSYTAAAKRLGISQSGASKAVSRLEADLGVQLLLRSTRKVSSTGIGKRLHDEVKEAMVKIDEALRAAQAETIVTPRSSQTSDDDVSTAEEKIRAVLRRP